MSETVVCVGAAVCSKNSVLAVRQAPGHSLEGQWTIPWGRLEEGESPVAAAIREVAEEAGIVASVDGLLGVQELPEPQSGWIALIYRCSHVSGMPAPDNRETDAARYLSAKDVDTLSDAFEPWSEWLVRRVLANDINVISSSRTNPYHPRIGFI